MKKTFGVVSCIANCQDCSWETESYKNGQAIAAKHAKHHGHLVTVEVVFSGRYDRRGSVLPRK